MKVLVTIFALLFVLCSAHLGLASVGDLQVRIKNELNEDMKIKVHCQEGDQSLGTQTLVKGMAVEWRIDTSHGSSPYFCDVEWNENDGYNFEAYSDSRAIQNCRSTCSWHLTEQGPLLRNQKTGSWEPMPFKPLPGGKEMKEEIEKEEEGIEKDKVAFDIGHHKCFCWPPRH